MEGKQRGRQEVRKGRNGEATQVIGFLMRVLREYADCTIWNEIFCRRGWRGK